MGFDNIAPAALHTGAMVSMDILEQSLSLCYMLYDDAVSAVNQCNVLQ